MMNDSLKSGFLCVNKPTGMTSFEVVTAAKRALGTKHVGHLGTIDKAGAGVLPIAVGDATKFFDYFLTKDKEYIAYFKFGTETDTLDSYGNITQRDQKIITRKELEEAAKTFLGESMQLPPQFSALKVNGKRAAERVVCGEEVVLKPRKVNIMSFDVLEQVQTNVFIVKIACSAGTYIRSIMRDIARKLDTCGTMIAIIRVKSGEFVIENSVLPSEIGWNKIIPINKMVKMDNSMTERMKRLCNDNK